MWFIHKRVSISKACAGLAAWPLILVFGSEASFAADTLPNACPVDGCVVKIADVKRSGDELVLTLKANYAPDMSKNHVHVWWGDNAKVEQVSDNAETVHHVKQAPWHPTDEYPAYTTQSAASMKVRGNSKTICVSPADRNHNILDVKISHCANISSLL